MKKYIVSFALLLICIAANAQRDIMLSQQFFSRLNINPSATGNTDDVDIFLIGRWQWMGVDDSPKSGVLNVSNYFESVHSGIGLSATYDDLGIANRTLNVKAAYAYHLNLNESVLLSLGLSGGILYHYFDPAQNIWLDPEELNNSTLNNGEVVSEIHPDLDFGAELATPKIMFGVSINHLVSNEDMVSTSLPGRQFNWYVRALFNLTEDFDFAPALVYTHRNSMNRAELNMMLFYKRFIWAGITYRPDLNGEDNFSSNMLQFTAGIEYKKFRFGYSFELGLGDIADAVSGNASEFMISYRIEKKSKHSGVRFLED